MATNNRPLKAYVRFDGSGRIVPGSLVLRRNKPKVGKWQEVPAYECCNPTTTTTTTLDPLCRQFIIDGLGNTLWSGIGCDGEEYTTGASLLEPQALFYCAQTIDSSNKPFEDIGVCGGNNCKTWLVSGTSVESYPATISYNDCEGTPASVVINEPTEICGLYVAPNLFVTIVETGPC
jgi:hypothetical protein